MKHFTKNGRRVIGWGFMAISVALFSRANTRAPGGWADDSDLRLIAVAGAGLTAGIGGVLRTHRGSP